MKLSGLVAGVVACISFAQIGCGSASNAGSGEAGAAGTNAAGAGSGAVSNAGTSGAAAGAGGVSAASGAGGSSGPTTVPEACAAYAATHCTHYRDCYGWVFYDYFSSVANCEAVSAQTCPLMATAPGSGFTIAQLNACTQATLPQTCEQWTTDTTAACVVAGTQANGMGCEFDAQCASMYCDIGGGATGYSNFCGKCAPSVSVNQVCDPHTSQCAAGLKCARSCPNGPCQQTDSTFVCTLPKGQNVACNSSAECADLLSCISGVCTHPSTAGQGCDVQTDNCDYDSICRTTGTGATCLKTVSVGLGAVCSSAVAQFCAGGLICASAGGSTQVDEGTCIAAGMPGAPCVLGICAQPARCLNDMCVAPPDANTCQ